MHYFEDNNRFDVDKMKQLVFNEIFNKYGIAVRIGVARNMPYDSGDFIIKWEEGGKQCQRAISFSRFYIVGPKEANTIHAAEMVIQEVAQFIKDLRMERASATNAASRTRKGSSLSPPSLSVWVSTSRTCVLSRI